MIEHYRTTPDAHCRKCPSYSSSPILLIPHLTINSFVGNEFKTQKYMLHEVSVIEVLFIKEVGDECITYTIIC